MSACSWEDYIMLGRVKRFIRKRLDTEAHPKIQAWFKERDYRKMLELQERHKGMTYAEIEAEISRNYRRMFGRTLNWDNPQTYNEKIHVSKVYMPTPLKTRLADKVAVREWITEKIGSEYLIPLLGVYDSFDEIDFDALPSQFVIKCNHDSGSVTLVKDKSTFNRALLRRYDVLLKRNYAWHGFEMHYRDIKPKIMVERYLGDVMNEYKFYCFDGKPYYCFTTFGSRNINLTINFYDMDWQLQTFTRPDHEAHTETVPLPPQYDEMKAIALRLSEGFAHVRVDLYVVDEHIYNGEMTFTTAGGWGKFSPDEWDYKLGNLWPFDNSIRQQVLSRSSRP